MNEVQFHTAANLTRDPELHFTPNGQAVASVGLAITPRRYDSAAQKYVDGQTTFLNGTVWGPQAEHVTSLTKGARVVVLGRLVTRVYTPATGPNAGTEQRRLEVVIDEIGPSLRWAEATVTKVTTQRPDEPPYTDEPPF
jgi:single-strand DNA-binding protein